MGIGELRSMMLAVENRLTIPRQQEAECSAPSRRVLPRQKDRSHSHRETKEFLKCSPHLFIHPCAKCVICRIYNFVALDCVEIIYARYVPLYRRHAGKKRGRSPCTRDLWFCTAVVS